MSSRRCASGWPRPSTPGCSPLPPRARRASTPASSTASSTSPRCRRPPAARRRAGRDVLIASGLWGLLRPNDRIPTYKLPIGDPVPGVGALAAAWRPLVAEALDAADIRRQLVVDCRSGAYATVWRPRRAAHVSVNAFREAPDGSRKPISHMAKASRGLVARAALMAPAAPRNPDALLAAVEAAGLDAELEPVGDGRWSLDVIER